MHAQKSHTDTRAASAPVVAVAGCPPRGRLKLARALRAIAVATAVAAAAGCAEWPSLAPPAFDVQGHRGARGLAPENTLPAFRRALALGVDTLETDLAVTRDAILVLSHDTRLNPALTRGPDGRWLDAPGPPIRSLTLAQVRGYDVGRLAPGTRYARQWPQQEAFDGERMPTLGELFALVRSSGVPVRFNIETKLTPTSGDDTPDPRRFAELVVAAIRAAGAADRVTVQSFDWRTLVHVKAIAPEIPTACLTIRSPGLDTVQAPAGGGASPWHAGLAPGVHGNSLAALVKAAGCETWSMFWRNLDAEALQQARALGLRVIPWTVNDPTQMRRLIAMGVDGLITDYPDRLLAALRVRER